MRLESRHIKKTSGHACARAFGFRARSENQIVCVCVCLCVWDVMMETREKPFPSMSWPQVVARGCGGRAHKWASGEMGGEAAAYVPCDLVRSWGLCAAWCDSEVALCAVRSVAIFKLVCSVGATLDQLVCNTT